MAHLQGKLLVERRKDGSETLLFEGMIHGWPTTTRGGRPYIADNCFVLGGLEEIIRDLLTLHGSKSREFTMEVQPV